MTNKQTNNTQTNTAGREVVRVLEGIGTVLADIPSACTQAVKVDDVVRSYDFGKKYAENNVIGYDVHGERACYVEGLVVEILTPGDVHKETGYEALDCERVVIRVTRRVFGGELFDLEPREFVFAPQNGAPTLFLEYGSAVIELLG